MNDRLIITDDGSHTLRHSTLGELYHSSRGAIGESMHVFIGAGLNPTSHRQSISIFEVGFGSGLNCYLTLCNSTQRIDYHTIEKYPIKADIVQQLNYAQSDSERTIFEILHSAPWIKSARPDKDGFMVNETFRLTKYAAEITEFDYTLLTGKFDLIYFDAFSPDIQPELWSEQVMHSMYHILRPDGALVTYSSKGLVKRALRAVGFEVERLEGALGKRHMLRARKV